VNPEPKGWVLIPTPAGSRCEICDKPAHWKLVDRAGIIFALRCDRHGPAR